MSTTAPTAASAVSIYQTLDETPKPVTLLLKGDSGSGKTTKAAYFPDPVFFNFDNNLSGLRKLPVEVRKRVRIIDPRRGPDGKEVKATEVWANFVKQLEQAGADPTVGTLVIDSLTTMAESLMDKIVKTDDPGRRIEIQEWGDFHRFMKWLGENLLCANDLDKHVIIIAHEQLKEDKLSGRIKYLLAVGGQTKSNFGLYFTDEWRTYTKPAKTGGGVEYWVRTLTTDYHAAKCSLNVPPDFEWDKEQANILAQIQSGNKKP